MRFYRVRPGYYESNEGHSIERHDALHGSPVSWVILYPGDVTGDVSRSTYHEAKRYVQDHPTV